MEIETQKFIRKPLYVDAVRVTAKNFDEISAWCGGEVRADEVPGQGTTKKYIYVRVHHPKNPRQTKAFIGDWLLYTERGYKVYTNKAFRAAFDPVQADSVITPPTPIEEVAEPEEQQPKASIDIVRENLGMTPQGEEPEQEVTVPPEALEDDTPVDAEVKRQITETYLKSVGPAAEEPSPETDVQPIQEVSEETSNEDNGLEPGEEYIPPPEQRETPAITPPPVDPNGKRVLTMREQREMTHHEVQQLLRSGEAILEQDLVA